MTRVCLVGDDDVDLRRELLASETARDALSSYDIEEPYANTVAVETISLGAAVSLLNDLNWYLVRYAADALVLEPSVSGTEWLSRGVARAIRAEELEPAATGELLKIYGVATPSPPDEAAESEDRDEDAPPPPASASPRLVEPLYARRVGEGTPEYDLRDVDDTVVVRVTPAEFGAST